MIAPVIPYAIRGAIWYQGESNDGRAYQYRTLFPLMIQNWRDDWGQGDFPFYFVQLANYKKIKDEPGESDWAELREAQSMTLKLPNTGQAVIIDYAEPGLVAREGKLKGFAVAGKDSQFVWAEAVIEGDQVVVWSDSVKKPVAVRYGWADNPICNLYSKVGLPASPFRTDSWPGIKAGNN